jgi:hypothetical protein
VSAPDDDPIPRQKLLELLPRRSLLKALTLLLMLGAIVYFQRHAGRVAEHVNKTMGPLLGSNSASSISPSRSAAPPSQPATPPRPTSP